MYGVQCVIKDSFIVVCEEKLMRVPCTLSLCVSVCLFLLCQVRAGDDVYLVGVANERFLVSSPAPPPHHTLELVLL